MPMTQTQTHPHRHDLRRRAERLIAALDATPAPQTLPDIMRAARTLMVIDRLLTQLWKTPPVKSGRQPMAEPVDVAPTVPDDARSRDIATTPSLNRHQRRLQAAQERNTRSDGKSIIRRETSSFPLSP